MLNFQYPAACGGGNDLVIEPNMQRNKYVQYGCGWSAPKTWRNFDASPTLRFESLPILGKLYTKNQSRFPNNVEYGDIIKGLPVPNNSCKAVYCSHILEHLSLEDFRTALRNTYKILEPDGIFRLVLPDLEFAINTYLEDFSSHEAAYNFMKGTSLGKEKRVKGLKGFVVEWFGNSQHLWMWDYRSLERELYDAGFCKIRRAQYGDSKEVMFNDVEKKGRWENCIGIECSKA